MARSRSRSAPLNGTNLADAMVLLLQNQASFVSSQTAFLSQLTAMHERFARIDRDLEQIKTILLRHEQLLTNLPEAVREKIGFKSGPGSPRSHSS